ncbi:hypothetical protein SAMN04487857_10262 [Pseudomonas sp. ok272]|uniref:DUF6543 domain-containing protein n=1 Tax=unclassified Pseudomonas TaxID=196821 RepID=UPI0008BABA57|nr:MULTISPECIES: DUF6543 domain-containing protein [unclassified Pseudomonas]SEM45170.1 hypothetical protein SAMN04487857_10262 [Pseudomonas sp. ok272]SFM16927.1 hypothetical protein SAMN04487858_10163 [Pseudomonas sp. ok602]
MTDSPAALFFPEALQDIKRLSPRLRAMSFTVEDLAWLRNVELATHTQRRAQHSPMTVDRIVLKIATADPVPLVGSFMMYPAPGGDHAVLYTPYGGLLKFDNLDTLWLALERTLKDEKARHDLLRLLPIAQRHTMAVGTPFAVAGELIEAGVFEQQAQDLAQSQRDNVAQIQAQLDELPSLTAMLNQLLDTLLGAYFPGVDQRRTVANYYASANPSDASQRRWISSKPLAEALLDVYLHQGWPSHQAVDFFHPSLPAGADSQAQNRHWHSVVSTLAAGLPSFLGSLLRRYWAEDVATTGTRRDLIAQAMGDKAHIDLLQKRQGGIISAQQSRELAVQFQRSDAPLTSTPDELRVEKVRLWEHRERFVEPACTLMLSNSTSAYLYNQAIGLQVLHDYADLKQTLRSMSTAAGHEDRLFNQLALQERNLFLGFNNAQVQGELLFGSVFKQLADDIIAKQYSNIAYALDTYRSSEGTIDLHALFDQALDVRGMLDCDLPAASTTPRWSTRPLVAGEYRPSILVADQVKQQLVILQRVQSAIAAKTAAQPTDDLTQQRRFLEGLKADLGHAMALGIRTEANLRTLTRGPDNDEQSIIDTVLNPDKPTRQQRLALHGFRPDAFSLSIECSGESPPRPLANCYLLTERGGLDEAHSGRAILWTPGRGLEVFDSLHAFKTEMGRRLSDSAQRLLLLENLSQPHCHAHQAYTLGPLRLIEGGLPEHCQQTAIDQYLADRQHQRTQTLPAASEVSGHLQSPLNLQRATLMAQGIIRKHTLPTWLGAAPDDEVQHHVEQLEQLRHSVWRNEDYLHGLQPFADYVRERLRALMAERFPHMGLDPDRIQVIPDLKLAGPAQTLTDFALAPAHVWQNIGFTLASAISQRLPVDFNAQEVKKLLLQLDIKTAYRQLIQATLADGATGLAQRLVYFVKQLPWQLLLHAHELKLSGKLSQASFALIQQVLHMPDALARKTVAGANAIVRPLALIATEGAGVAKTLGMYLIGAAGGHGPLVLYAPYDKHLGLLEVENEASLIDAFHFPGPVQELLIRRLLDPYKALYRNLLEGNSSSDIRLANQAIDGNFLLTLFNDNRELLIHMLGSQTERSAQADWSALSALFTQGIKYTSEFLPGRLAIPRLLWNSYTAFEASAQALQDHQWKAALGNFINGVARMLAIGKQLREPASLTPLPVTGEGAALKPAAVVDDLGTIDPTSGQRSLLQPFEAIDVELKNLGPKRADGTYLDAKTWRTYVPVQGKVYRVDQSGAAPRLVIDQHAGPYVQNNAAQWVLDLGAQTVHFGKAMSRMQNRYQAHTVAHRFINVEARGMEQIRVLFPERARLIIQALDLARFYAFNSLHNLAQLKTGTVGTRLDGFLKELFDVAVIDTATLQKIGNAIIPLCKALVDPTLDQLDHRRFVVGSNRFPDEGLIAFVLDEDQQQKVHFTERFFEQGLEHYTQALTAPFDVLGHAQASTLIHEFAHLVCGAIDIAGVEARRPFSDLISTVSPHNRELKEAQQKFQREALSMRTPRDELFAYWHSEREQWESFDELAMTRPLSDKIKRITGTDSMIGARRVFRDRASADRRIEVILHNADSIARLICEMGRQLDSPAQDD